MLKYTKLAASLSRSAVSLARPLSSSACLLSLRSVRRCSLSLSPKQIAYQRISPLQWRPYSSVSSNRVVDEPAQVVSFDDVKAIVDKNDPNVVLVDVREPSEYEEGHIGNAVNIPFKSMPGALGLEASEFEHTLGFEKPSTDKTLVFYCLGGVRSTSSEQLASTYGYKHRKNYLGSYQDWLNKTAKK